MSAYRGEPLRDNLVVFGEVGLTGEVRACVGVQRRLQEAARLGLTHAVIPARGADDVRPVDGIEIFPVSDLATGVRVGLP